jgi:hypothetical protein
MKVNVYAATYDAGYIYFQKAIIFSTYGETYTTRDRKYAGVPLTFKHISTLVYDFHMSQTQYRRDYTTFPDDFALRMCGYNNRSRTVLMLHGLHAGRKTEKRDIKNNNSADSFTLV